MYCAQCGAPVEEHLKFCTQCGARISRINESREEQLQSKDEENQQLEVEQWQEEQNREIERINAEKALSRPVVKSQPRPQTRRVVQNAEMQRQQAYRQKGSMTGRRYQWEDRRGINGFAETLLAIIVNPIGSGEELYIRLSKMTTLIYMAAVLLISSCGSYLIYITSANRVAILFSSLFEYLFGYGTVQYVLDELNIQVLMITIMSSVLLVVYMTALVMGLYRVVLKVDIEWIECIQLMLMPIVIGFFGKVVILIVGIISVKAMLVMCVLVLMLVAVLTVVQFINRLGLSALTVYTMPAVYIVCSGVRLLLIIQILKGYI